MTVPTEGSIRDLLDKQAISEVILRYCRGVDRGDAELITSAYHPDAVDDHGVSRFTGETVGPGIIDIMRTSPVSMHHVTNQFIVLHGDDQAGCETYYTVWQTMDGDGQHHLLHALGRYIDRFERRQGEWKIAHRLVIVDLVRMQALEGELPSSEPGRGRRDRDDPSYRVLKDA